MKTNLILIYFVFLVTNISMAEPAGKKEDKGTINQQTQQNEDKKIDDAEVEKYYAKLKYPPGFYQGAFLISFMGGGSLAPSGSFISHEKKL